MQIPQSSLYNIFLPTVSLMELAQGLALALDLNKALVDFILAVWSQAS